MPANAVVVGVNAFATESAASIDVMSIDPEIERRQVERVGAVRAGRDADAWRAEPRARCRSGARRQTISSRRSFAPSRPSATVGEIADAMRAVFGEHKEVDV